jgi:hypothetical protein
MFLYSWMKKDKPIFSFDYDNTVFEDFELHLAFLMMRKMMNSYRIRSCLNLFRTVLTLNSNSRFIYHYLSAQLTSIRSLFPDRYSFLWSLFLLLLLKYPKERRTLETHILIFSLIKRKISLSEALVVMINKKTGGETFRNPTSIPL